MLTRLDRYLLREAAVTFTAVTGVLLVILLSNQLARILGQAAQAGLSGRIVLALDRYISFWEQRNQPRTIDYPFTFIEMRVDAKGEGEGKMSIATKVKTASVTLVCSSPSRERRQASTLNFIDVRPTAIRSAYTDTSSPTCTGL